MNICYLRYVSLDYTIGYTETLNLINYMSNKKYNIYFIVMKRNNKKHNLYVNNHVFFYETPSLKFSNNNIKIIKFVNFLIYNIFSLFYLIKIHGIRKIDYIHYYPENISVPIFSMFFKNIKFILDIRKPTLVQIKELESDYKFINFLILIYNLLENISLKISHGIIVITKGVKFYIKQKISALNLSEKFKNKIVTIPSIVDLNHFKPVHNIKYINYLKKKYKINDQEKIILYMGSISKARDFHKVLLSIYIIIKKGYKIKFLILGKIDKYFNSLINTLKLNSYIIIKYIPYDKIPYYIEMSDLCISYLPNSPTYKYSCPIKVLEYMAMEKPVIATNILAHSKIIKNNIQGILTNPNEYDFANSIVFFLDNINNAKILSKNSRKYLHKYSQKVLGQKYEKFLISIKD